MNQQELLKNRTAIAAIEFKDAIEPSAEAMQYLVSELNQLCFYSLQKEGLDPNFRAEVQALNAQVMRLSAIHTEMLALLDSSALERYIKAGEALVYETVALQSTSAQRA